MIGNAPLIAMDAYADRQESARPKSAPQPPLTHREARLIVLGVLLPTFMGSLDQTILANALPTIGREFGDIHNLPWLITAYLLAATAAIPLYGKIADIHGRRLTLRIAILTYMAGSLVCALAPNMLVLIFGRVLHGLGGGGLSSMGMVVLGDLVAPKERGRYYGYFAATYTTAGGSGPCSEASSPTICTGRSSSGSIFPWGWPRSRSPPCCCAGCPAMSARISSTSSEPP